MLKVFYVQHSQYVEDGFEFWAAHDEDEAERLYHAAHPVPPGMDFESPRILEIEGAEAGGAPRMLMP